MASKNCMWALVVFCGSLLVAAAPTVTQAADQADAGKSKAKPDTVTCRYVDSPGSRVKRRVCGTSAHWAADSRVTSPMPSSASPAPSVVPGMSEFGNPANQSAYQSFR
jgi:hypothetical protein